MGFFPLIKSKIEISPSFMRTKIRKSKQRYKEQLVIFRLDTLQSMRNNHRLHRTIEFCGRGFVDLRVNFRGGRMLLRLRPHSWLSINLSLRLKYRVWRWTMECPVCLSNADTLLLHADRGAAHCSHCESLPSMRTDSRRRVQVLRRAIRSGGYGVIAEHLADGGSRALAARHAMELDGLSPPLLLPESQKRQFQIFGHRLRDPWAALPKRPQHRLVYAGELIWRPD